MTTLIIDTETHKLHGNAIEIAWLPLRFDGAGKAQVDLGQAGQTRLNPLEKIDIGAMAVHHIIDADVIDKPPHNEFKFPEFSGGEVRYLIGHNIDYDVAVVNRCGIDTSNIKTICTLAMAIKCWPEIEKHNLTYLTYALSDNQGEARSALKNAHAAWDDVHITKSLLSKIIKLKEFSSIEDLYKFSEFCRVPTHLHFGKYNGYLLADVPIDYIYWMLKNMQLDAYMTSALKDQIIAKVGA